VTSWTLVAVPTTAPSRSTSGDTVRLTGTRAPSARSCTVSKRSTRWPPSAAARARSSSSRLAAGCSTDPLLPTASVADRPYSRAAAAFHVVMVPARSWV
jgi:hypothetical protein